MPDHDRAAAMPISNLAGGIWMRLFVGLDASLAKTAICVVSEYGKIVREAEVISEAEPMMSCSRPSLADNSKARL